MHLQRYVPAIASIFVVSFIGYADAQKAPSPNLAPLNAIDQRISHIETQLRSLQAQSNSSAEARQQYLAQLDSRKAYLEKLQNDITKAERNLEQRKDNLDKLENDVMKAETDVADSKFNISNQYFGIFIGVFTLVITAMIGVGGATFFLIRELVTRSEIPRQVRAEIAAQIGPEAQLNRAGMLALLALVWWRRYEDDYMSFVAKNLEGSGHGPHPSFLVDVKTARRLAEAGLDELSGEELQRRVNSGDAFALQTYAALKNHYVYNKTAEFICSGSDDPDESSGIIRDAQECLALSRNVKIQEGFWYLIQDTAAFTLIQLGEQLGDRGLQEKGRQLMRELFELKAPKPGFDQPPAEWLAEIWEGYFPMQANGRRLNLLGLGDVPSPARP